VEAQAKQRYILMSPRKIRRVLNLIRGKKVVEALNILRLTPYAASDIVYKKLIEALHNARQMHGVLINNLVVSQAIADEGPAYKRMKPRAQGRMFRREKPTSHLTIVVKATAE
jgi:large subunit ribosomal protein L22